VGSNDGILYVFVSNEDCAAEIETNHSDDLAAAAEQVFSQPIRIVNADGLFQPSKKRHLEARTYPFEASFADDMISPAICCTCCPAFVNWL
jgi:hypothetical protein